MGDYNEGDLIEAVRGESVIRGRVAERMVKDSLRSVDGLLQDGYTITVIEKAKSQMPTVEGWYSVDKTGHPSCRLLSLNHGRLREFLPSGQAPDGFHTPSDLAESAIREGRLTKLEPVPETAKRVLERLASWWENGPPAAWVEEFNAVAVEFGVTK
jgi:hypothetical protein